MNTWIFSKNGVVTEPLDLAKAKKYVIDNPDAYGWQASFTQWLPVNSINEFAALLPKQEVAAQVPKKIVDEFRAKEQTLDSHFDKLNQELAASEINAQNFAHEIATYKELTVNLSDEVKNNISEIEQQYQVLVKQLKTFRLEVKSSHQVLDNVVKVFNEKIDGKAIVNTPVKHSTAPNSGIKAETKTEVVVEKTQAPVDAKTKSVSKADEVHKATGAKAEVAETKEEKLTSDEQNKVTAISTRVPKPQGAKVISTRSKHPNSVRVSSTVQSDKKIEKLAPTTQNIASAKSPEPEVKKEAKSTSPSEVKENVAVSDEQVNQVNNLHSKLESGVKNIFKSVFSKEQPVEQKNSFADLVQQDKVNEEVKPVETIKEIEAVVDVESHDDEALTKRRKRRRR